MYKTKKISKIVLISLAILLVFSLGGCAIFDWFLGSLGPDTDNVPEDALTILEQCMAYLTEEYVDELNDEQLMAAAVAGANAIMSFYDDYGMVLTPEEYHELIYPQQEHLNRPIFGFSFTQVPYLGLYVQSVTVDSMAYKAGLKAGDVIVDIVKASNGLIPTPDGKFEFFVEGESDARQLDVKTTHFDYIQRVLADKDRAFFYILRGAQQVDGYFTGGEMLDRPLYIIKGTIDDTHTDGKMYFVDYYASAESTNVSADTINLRDLTKLDSTDIGYLHIKSFGDLYDASDNFLSDTASEVKSALAILKHNGKTKIILDLQGNPGGDITQIINTCAYFVHNDGKTVNVATIEGRELYSEYNTDSKYSEFFPTKEGTNIVVLTDSGSASASEMLTGAILAYNTGVQVGSTTFGKGIAQTYTPISSPKDIFLTDGSKSTSFYAVYYTMGKYYNVTPNGEKINIHGVGYSPLEENTFFEYADQINRALEILGE